MVTPGLPTAWKTCPISHKFIRLPDRAGRFCVLTLAAERSIAMVSAPSNSWLFSWRRVFVFGAALLLITLLVEPSDVFAASAPHITSPTTDSGTVGVAYTYQITVRSQDYPISVWGATPIPPGLSFNSTTGLIAGTPTDTITN